MKSFTQNAGLRLNEGFELLRLIDGRIVGVLSFVDGTVECGLWRSRVGGKCVTEQRRISSLV